MSDILTSTKRIPFDWIEIDQPLCALTYGVSACQAAIGVTGSDKCFNTRATCQDPDNYDQSDSVTLYFCKNRGVIPDDKPYEPLLDSVSYIPPMLNPGGGNASVQAIGKRGGLSVTLSDQPHTDVIVDPYVTGRSYDPFTRSTFWAKWRARNPYYMYRVIRYYSGYISPDTGHPDTDTLKTRTFFISGFSGPTADNSVMIEAKDILHISSDDRAKAPRISTGKLDAAINTLAASLDLKPVGVGDAEYPYSGYIRVGREVMGFTRATGSDTLSITRGEYGTVTDEHAEDDTAQLCLVYDAQTPEQIIYDLLTGYADVDPQYLNTDQWAQETADFLSRGYSAIITQPTGVNSLLNEISDQMFLSLYWDDQIDISSPMVGGLILKAVRPAYNETITELNDDSHLLESSVTWNDRDEDLITQVWVRYAQIDPTESVDLGTNYAATDVFIDADAEGETRHNTSKVKTINARWLGAADGAAATELGERILARYSRIPRECFFSVDASVNTLKLADFLTITNRNQVDQYGMPQPVALQIIKLSESVQGAINTVHAIEYSGAFGDDYLPGGEYTIDISANMYNVNLLELFKDKYPTVTITGTETIRYTIRQGVIIGAVAASAAVNELAVSASLPPLIDLLTTPHNKAAIITGETESGTVVWPEAWPIGTTLKLVISAGSKVLGEGGNGVHGDVVGASGNGGPALEVAHDILITNYGLIAGGGGAGGGVTFYKRDESPVAIRYLTGGGGAGYNIGYAFNTLSIQGDRWAANSGFDINNFPRPGVGGKVKTQYPTSILPAGPILSTGLVTFEGGAGGEVAQAGNGGAYSFGGLSAGGSAGSAVQDGVELITWVVKGDVRGAEL